MTKKRIRIKEEILWSLSAKRKVSFSKEPKKYSRGLGKSKVEGFFQKYAEKLDLMLNEKMSNLLLDGGIVDKCYAKTRNHFHQISEKKTSCG